MPSTLVKMSAAGFFALLRTRLGRVAVGCVVWALLRRASSYFSKSCYVQFWLSRLAARLSTKIDPGTRCDVVHLYRQLEMSKPTSHSHAEAATERNAALRSLQAFAMACGLDAYAVSASTREKDAGYHSWWMAKDVAHQPVWRPVTSNDMIIFVDSDYYADIRYWASHGRPMAMYTFAPKKVCGTVANGYYQIDQDNTVNYAVAGGALYRHRIWDYDADHITFDYWTCSIVYSVEIRDLHECRRLVFFTPIARVPAPLGWMLEGQRLSRKIYCFGLTLVNLYTSNAGVMYVSVALLGSGTSIDLELGALQAMWIRFQTSKKPMIWDVETFLQKQKCENSSVVAPHLYAYLQQSNCRIMQKISTISVPPESHESRPTNYLAYTGEHRVFKEIGRVVAPQLVRNPDVCPAVSEANDMASVVGRVNSVLNDTVPPNQYVGYAQEFVRLMVPDSGVGVPWSGEQVAELWTSPLQRARVEKAESWMLLDPQLMIRAMMKHETYANYADPRNISTFPAQHNLQLARFTYPVKTNILKKLRSYAPGMTPQEIERRIVELCTEYDVLVETDFSRFDGTISVWLRQHVERPIYTRYYGGEDRRAVGLLIDAEIKAQAKTATGLAYNPRGSRGSGSSLTTDGNSEINMFVSYCALRISGLNPEESFARVGLMAGDDGLTPADAAVLEKVAKDLGLRLKATIRRASDWSPIGFLARVFPSAWSGHVGNFTDQLRALRKLHISFAPGDVSDVQALVNKAHGYSLLETANTIVGKWCRNVLAAHSGYEAKITSYDSPYYVWLSVAEGGQFNGWSPVLDPLLADRFLADQIGCMISEITPLRDFLETGGWMVPEELRLPNDPPEEKIPVVITQSQWNVLPDWAKRVVYWSRDTKPVRVPAPPSTVKTNVVERKSRGSKEQARKRTFACKDGRLARGKGRPQTKV